MERIILIMEIELKVIFFSFLENLESAQSQFYKAPAWWEVIT